VLDHLTQNSILSVPVAVEDAVVRRETGEQADQESRSADPEPQLA